jgi:predicted SprT family Zn-dependent metalloprotease
MNRHEIAAQEIRRCQAILLEQLGMSVQPEVRWDIKPTANLNGQAQYRNMGCEKVIRLNPGVADAVGADFAQTVGHEFAHIVAYEIYYFFPKYYPGDRKELRGHGRGWKWLMNMFNLRADRCNSYQEHAEKMPKASDPTRFTYACGHCGHLFHLTKIMHNKIQKGSIRWHSKCGRTLGRVVFRPQTEAPKYSFAAYK